LEREREDRTAEELRLKAEIERQIQIVAESKEDTKTRLAEKEQRVEEQRQIARDYQNQTERMSLEITELQKQIEEKKRRDRRITTTVGKESPRHRVSAKVKSGI